MFIVYDKDMNKKEFPQGVRPLDIFISSMDTNRVTEYIEGVPGVTHKGSTPYSRFIELSVALTSEDTKDYRLLRDEAYAFFSDDYFYISETYQKGKRYKVSLTQSYTPTRHSRTLASMRFTLEMTDLPFAESIGTTQDIQANGISADDELWGYGMGLLAEDDSLVYTVNAQNGVQFGIYNAGNLPIHPFYQDLKITINNAVSIATFLELKNDTNDTTFKVNEVVSNSQEIILDGPNITSNGLQYLRNTNKGFIQLSPGWNYFTLSGADATINFDFRFYYK